MNWSGTANQQIKVLLFYFSLLSRKLGIGLKLAPAESLWHKKTFHTFPTKKENLTSFLPSCCSHACTTSPLSVRTDTVVVVTTLPPGEVLVLVTVVTVTTVVELLLLESSISGANIL